MRSVKKERKKMLLKKIKARVFKIRRSRRSSLLNELSLFLNWQLSVSPDENE